MNSSIYVCKLYAHLSASAPGAIRQSATSAELSSTSRFWPFAKFRGSASWCLKTTLSAYLSASAAGAVRQFVTFAEVNGTLAFATAACSASSSAVWRPTLAGISACPPTCLHHGILID